MQYKYKHQSYFLGLRASFLFSTAVKYIKILNVK